MACLPRITVFLPGIKEVVDPTGTWLPLTGYPNTRHPAQTCSIRPRPGTARLTQKRDQVEHLDSVEQVEHLDQVDTLELDKVIKVINLLIEMGQDLVISFRLIFTSGLDTKG